MNTYKLWRLVIELEKKTNWFSVFITTDSGYYLTDFFASFDLLISNGIDKTSEAISKKMPKWEFLKFATENDVYSDAIAKKLFLAM